MAALTFRPTRLLPQASSGIARASRPFARAKAIRFLRLARRPPARAPTSRCPSWRWNRCFPRYGHGRIVARLGGRAGPAQHRPDAACARLPATAI